MAEQKSKSKEKSDKPRKEKKQKKETSKDATSLSLLADENNVDTKLSSLFAVKAPVKKPSKSHAAVLPAAVTGHEEGDASIQSTAPASPTIVPDDKAPDVEAAVLTTDRPAKKRKRKEEADDLEDKYMRKLARQFESSGADESPLYKQLDDTKHTVATNARAEDEVGEEDESLDEASEGDTASQGGNAETWTPPQHESLTEASLDLDKAGRTVFIGNVSTTAITTKSARKTLEKHLTSFFDDVSKPATYTKAPTNKLESLRFRSTPYAPTLPKKAAYARGDVASTTAQSTNAYVVYSSPALAREACRRLNGSVVLERHIRVDSVAHPAPTSNKRCVFVGNLGFVDDETNIIAANEAEGREKRRQNQKPSDVEEGLWRLFSKHGTVESVRVVRDKNTRIGIGIAYVQFTDEIAVESALSEDGKKAPPMLPRKLRVTRAKVIKRSKSNVADKPRGKPAAQSTGGYQRKVTPGEATLRGRVGKLLGKAAAAMSAPGFKRPESFVFEGHRASSKQKNSGLKLGKGNSKKKGKPTTRSAKRAAAYKSGTVKKSTS